MMPEVGIDVCPRCVAAKGLCDRHHVGVLPLLARNIGWLKLMAETLVAQKKRQHEKALSVSAEQAAHRERKKTARSTAAARRASGIAAHNSRMRSLARLAAA